MKIIEKHTDLKQHLLQKRKRRRNQWIRAAASRRPGRDEVTGLEASKAASDYLNLPNQKVNQ